MTILALDNSITRTYTNKGQHAEQVMRYTLTGKIEKADNKPHTLGGDCLDIQIKTAKATVCKGFDLDKYLDMDGAKRYAYVLADFSKAVIMSRTEWTEFVNTFAYKAKESAKNGGGDKLRLLSESKRMIEWLTARV